MPAGQSAKPNPRVLVMDDDEDILLLAQRGLGRRGYSVAVSLDGAHALSLYQEARQAGEPFIAVIADLNIPGAMGGRELAARLREIDPQALVIVSSGNPADPAMIDPGAHGFAGQIAKPYQFDELHQLLLRLARLEIE